MKIWYEVFITLKTRTRTLSAHKTLKEARLEKENIIKKKGVCVDGMLIDIDNPNILHIDSWINPDNPNPLKEYE